jgi:two-component system NtrC family sensor kinase
MLCSLSLKSAILAFSAAVTCRIVGKEKDSLRRLDIQRHRLRRLERTDKDRTHQAARNEGLAQVGLESLELFHDLKNPITVILGTACLLLEAEGFPEALREDLRRIERSAQFCRRLAGGVLRAARQTSEEGVFDLADVVDNALVLYEKRFARGSIQVECRTPHGSVVRGDAVEIQRVFMNLFGNAADAMLQGGVLRVDLSREESSVCAAVEDTGAGIDAKTLPALFQAFATTKGDKGTGLGLYLSREIARRHGGELSVENAPRGGARFLLSLPVLAEASTLPIRLT